MKKAFCETTNNAIYRNSLTLTASAYHPLSCKQVVLATMQCKQEDKENIEIFWRMFNKAYKKANNEVDEKFHLTGWCTDMTFCNFIGWCTDMVSCNLIA